MSQKRSDVSHINIIVTIICALIVAITSIVASRIAREKVTVYEYKEVPAFDNINTTSYFPLSAGNSWNYEGTVTIFENETLKISEKKISITMSVQDEIKNGNLILFIIKGNPSDASQVLFMPHINNDNIKVPSSFYGYLVVSNKIFFIDENRLDDVVKRMKEKNYNAYDILKQDDIEFEFPLFKGLRYGEVSQITRSDLRYFWYVNDKITFHESRGDNVSAVSEYQLVYNTSPDYDEIVFRPYLGIISYKYIHHGTKNEISLSLTHYNIVQK